MSDRDVTKKTMAINTPLMIHLALRNAGTRHRPPVSTALFAAAAVVRAGDNGEPRLSHSEICHTSNRNQSLGTKRNDILDSDRRD